jgi:hypothetical protein
MVLRSHGEHLGEGEAMSAMDREFLLREASKQKLRGMRLRDFGDAAEQWEATLNFRKAAKNELAAFDLQTSPSEEEQARAHIEACGLFLDAHDPIRAAEQWNQIPRKFFPPNDEASWLDKLSEPYQDAIHDFGEHWRAIKSKPHVIPDVDQLSQQQLQSLVKRYPGVPEFWWALSKHEKEQSSLEHAKQLEPDFLSEQFAVSAWKCVEDPFVRDLSVKLDASRRGKSLGFYAVNQAAMAFEKLLNGFTQNFLAQTIELIPIGATPSSFKWNIKAWGLPSYAIAELQERAVDAPAEVGAKELVQLLEQLAEHQIDLTASTTNQAPQLIFDAPRRKSMLDAAHAVVSEKIDSNDVPQANLLDRVFRIVDMCVNGEEISAETLKVKKRQVDYYRRATKILGFMSESNKLTSAGRQLSRLQLEERLRATVVHFESSICGEAWIRWAKKRTLLEIEPETARDFIEQCVAGLSSATAERRAQSLISWHAELIPYHYAKS